MLNHRDGHILVEQSCHIYKIVRDFVPWSGSYHRILKVRFVLIGQMPSGMVLRERAPHFWGNPEYSSDVSDSITTPLKRLFLHVFYSTLEYRCTLASRRETILNVPTLRKGNWLGRRDWWITGRWVKVRRSYSFVPLVVCRLALSPYHSPVSLHLAYSLAGESKRESTRNGESTRQAEKARVRV